MSKGNGKLPRGMKKEWKPLANVALEQGWTISLTRGNHYSWRSPQGEQVFSPSTASDFHSIDRVILKLRRAGLEYRRNREQRKSA
jgi:hypothetical protein